MYLSNFPQFLTLGLICTATSGCTRYQPKTNKIPATGGQIKLTIDNVETIFNTNTGNAMKIINAGGA